MLDFYKEMKMVDLIKREPIYKSKLLMEKVPGMQLNDGTDVYFVPVTAERLKDPLFSFLKDAGCYMIGTIVDVITKAPGSVIHINGNGHVISDDELKGRIGEYEYANSLEYYFAYNANGIRTDGTDVYVEYNSFIVKVTYIAVWFKNDTVKDASIYNVLPASYMNEGKLFEDDKVIEQKDLLNALIVYFNTIEARNTKQIEELLWENISVASDRDTLRQIQVTGTYYPECSSECRKENYNGI